MEIMASDDALQSSSRLRQFQISDAYTEIVLDRPIAMVLTFMGGRHHKKAHDDLNHFRKKDDNSC